MNARPDPVYRDAVRPTVFQDGLEFQDFVCTELAKCGVILQNLSSRKYQFEVGENLQGFEIKLDEWCTKSRRLSIEVAEKSRNDPALKWTPSGIARTDNSWLYIQGNRSILFVFAKRSLLAWHKQRITAEMLEEKHGTITTFYLDFADAYKIAAKVLEFPPRS